ncbi:FAD/NAD(P)-binding domain-containing protein [Wolfiporia cocos MD-104 SS10]|uniref:FAD/NAD(P)-binding domain-containing protein n=1 Tax=Wolfiporia cocos (strain MD-104) TaxID=742152 RepID=A0A2H3JHZ7_WOLCO|nr:FAD/NAD(P)-binding domain-containing protein [Wolfiporia cocos MD-104 SS10]
MPATNPKFRIAICGGGIGGLALAAVLARHEREDSPIEVNLYEGRPEITTFGAGITVWQRTWRVMQLLGIDGQLAEASVRPPNKGIGPGFTYRRGDNDTNPFTYHTVMLPYGSSSMHRADLVGVLKSNIPSRYKIHVSKKLSKYIEIADTDGQIKHIELTFTDGTTAEADILIGADGIKSAVRSTMYDLAHQHECSLDIGRDDCPRCSAATPKWTGMIAYRYLIPTERLKKVNPNHQGLRSTLCVRRFTFEYLDCP